MGSRGPSKTSKAVLKMRGSWLADSRGDEPQAEAPRSLRCPSWVSAEGKRAWKIVVKQMGAMRILTMADVNVVSRYCDVWARWRKAHDFVMEKGEGYPVMRKGEIVAMHKYPQTTVANQLLSELVRLEDRMGLSPASRTSLAVDSKAVLHEPASKARFFKR